MTKVPNLSDGTLIPYIESNIFFELELGGFGETPSHAVYWDALSAIGPYAHGLIGIRLRGGLNG